MTRDAATCERPTPSMNRHSMFKVQKSRCYGRFVGVPPPERTHGLSRGSCSVSNGENANGIPVQRRNAAVAEGRVTAEPRRTHACRTARRDATPCSLSQPSVLPRECHAQRQRNAPTAAVQGNRIVVPAGYKCVRRRGRFKSARRLRQPERVAGVNLFRATQEEAYGLPHSGRYVLLKQSPSRYLIAEYAEMPRYRPGRRPSPAAWCGG